MAGLSVAVVSLGASVYPVAPAAGADQIGTAKAQVSALQAQVVASAGRIRQLTLAYQEANTRAGVLAQQVASDKAQLAALQGRVDATRRTLRQEAILGYTGATVEPTNVVGTHSATGDPVVRAEYLQVAAGDISNTVDRYRTQAAQLASAESALATEERAASQAVASTDSARNQALTQASAVQTQLQQVQGRLNQLIAAQAAAEAARAAAAQAAAQAATAARPAAPAPPPSPAPPTQGLPVNDGLISVVRTVVAPTPAPTPAPASTGGGAGGVWLQLRQCESGDNYQANTGNGFYGAYQFSPSTWTGMGYPGRPDLEPPAMQDQAAQRLQAQSGWGQWPACSAALGLH
ncbi:MAG TPA: transglycosylase family protein [Acidimicrobiales bacterium]|nr:transglycosylase family protein [Acidimicrobiales bacterium]